MAMIEDLRLWVGKDVLDAEGKKTGKLVDVYFDVETDSPVFLLVDMGRKRPGTLVPAWNAVTTPDHITVAYEEKALEGAPGIVVDEGLATTEEATAFAYYGVEYKPSATASGRRLMRR
jgi:sporulation protein YlmC with PRC-barrel domain